MKEDVLEQIVDDYLQFQGYFTTHNVRFRPSRDQEGYDSKLDSVPSDIDVVGYHPTKTGTDKVVAVSCKAWQTGFDASVILAQLRGEARNPVRPRELQLRELWIPKWAVAFRRAIKELTGQEQFTYLLAVTWLRGDPQPWSDEPHISNNLGGNPFRFLPLEQMWSELLTRLTTTPAPSEIGRLAQLLKAAGLTAGNEVVPPSGPVPGSDAALEDDHDAL